MLIAHKPRAKARHTRIFLVAVSLSAVASCADPGEDSDGEFDDLQGRDHYLAPRPPEICTAHHGCGVPSDEGGSSPAPTPSSGSSRGTPNACANTSNCFGAIGIRCGGAPDPSPWLASLPPPLDAALDMLPENLDYFLLSLGCQGSRCWINAGSWRHDTCCASNPSGRWCSGPASWNNSGCEVSWDDAVKRTLSGLNWQRTIDRCADPRSSVNFSEFCAPNGTIVASGDALRCCGGSSRPLIVNPFQAGFFQDSQRLSQQGVRLELTTLFGFNLVVCRAS